MSYFNTIKVRSTTHPLKTIEVHTHKTSQMLTQGSVQAKLKDLKQKHMH